MNKDTVEYALQCMEWRLRFEQGEVKKKLLDTFHDMQNVPDKDIKDYCAALSNVSLALVARLNTIESRINEVMNYAKT